MTKRIIPSLLLRGGRLVKGKQCRDYRDAGNPATTIRALCNQGADEIILLNIGQEHDWQALEKAQEHCFVPLTYGGGIRTQNDARTAFLCGCDKVFIGARKVELADQLADQWGSQAIVLGCDNNTTVTRAGEIRLLDTDNEGTRQGFRLSIPKLPTPIIVEGGIGNLDHIAQAFKAGADAVALGAMLTFGDNNILKLKRHLKAVGFCVRL